MRITRFDPFRELKELESRLYQNYAQPTESNISGFMPTVNTREGEHAYHIEVDLPGVNREDIHVDLKDNLLTLSGERKYRDEKKAEDYYKVESAYGRFQRSFSIPDNADVENIHAESKEGVLEVVIPKRAEMEAKKIEIR